MKWPWSHPPGDMIDLDEERAKRGGAYQVPCPKCAERVSMYAEKCPHCGVWFHREAIEVAKRQDLFHERRVNARNRVLSMVILISLGVIVLVGLVFGVLR